MAIVGPLLLAALSAGHVDLYRTGPRYSGFPWFDAAISVAKQERLVYSYSSYDPKLPPRRMSRYEIAVAFHATLTNHLAVAEGDADAMKLSRLAVLVPFYRRAAAEFRPELDALGVPKELEIGRVAEATRRAQRTLSTVPGPFRDVPARHWAAKAVGDLRALGMLDGYPDGRFRG